MASCFDISLIDAWNTGDENVTDGSVDDYDFDWGGTVRTPDENSGCGCQRCQTDTSEQEPEETSSEDITEEQNPEDYPIVQL